MDLLAEVLLAAMCQSRGKAEGESEVIETDRTRILTYQACHLKRYLGFHAFGKGLERKSKSLPLCLGGAFHVGSAQLLLFWDIESAVKAAQDDIDTAFDNRAVELDEIVTMGSVWDYSRAEQSALVEGLLRAWDFYNGAEFKERFEVLSVEQEGRATLSTDGPLVLLFRPDAVVRERASGDCYVVSWKTTSMFSRLTTNSSRTDMQSMSEVYGVENRHCDDEGCEHAGIVHQCNNPHIEGVLYLYMVKGKRSKDDWDGLYKQDSHLIYGWTRGSGDEQEWSFKWTWTDEAEINEKTGKPVKHTLGKGWRKLPIWSSYPGGVKQWIADLGAHRINPRHLDPFESIFPQSMPVERRADEVESWRTQVINQELRVEENVVKVMAGATREDERVMLDTYFPQYSHSCYSYSHPCPFQSCCWEGVKAEPGELFQLRISNHPESKGDDDNG